jgi:putative FmdB family regulatory protein
MPVYEYRCKSCGKTHEIEQGFHDERPTECPSCGGQLLRVFHPIGVVFKGSGFYKTDYGGSGASRSGGAGSAEGGGDAKPADSTPSDSKESKESKSAPSESKATETKSSDTKAKTDSKPSGPPATS